MNGKYDSIYLKHADAQMSATVARSSRVLVASIACSGLLLGLLVSLGIWLARS